MLSIFSTWQFWCIIIIGIILVMYLVYGGKRDYSITGLQTLSEYCDFQNQHRHDLTAELADLYTVPQFTPPSRNLPPDLRWFKSKGEMLCSRALEAIVNRPVEVNVRNLGLINPQTRRQLEIDCYDPISKIGVEYNGIQHYTYPNSFHKSREDFEAQVQRDGLKAELCAQRGIRLVTIPYVIDTCIPTPSGFVTRKHTDGERYQRIYDFMVHTLQGSEAPHYTTHV